MSDTLYSDDAVTLEARDAALYLKGAPGFDNAPELARAGINWLEKYQGAQVSFNLCGVNRTSSATISVLLEWLRMTQKKTLEVDRITLSDSMRELIEMAELSDVFPAHETSFATAGES
ncbi:STAS domain-containing protein [Kushneria indalinina]|uniref:Phospholipid transport system transporter-binding protein n=1 Tax=Kushneria indalinina DSM 14324 TaxID=1122140 RepID=A0A3D9E0H5_9GAMM|nr:STAS domain-containing protein [Kushneria indalinina]REC96540.1 phospholipid transport system transporter-binding protein [Kushneria indalinina DSM 14324]